MNTISASRAEDLRWMRRALRLAERAYGTPPNPMVGCVLVKNGTVVGEGYTQPVGQAHAEVMALRQAGAKAAGATAYVTLEPCAHWGRTPPCADALIAAQVGRVVAATVDSDTRTAGKGIEKLRVAGIPVEVGLLEAQARDQNRAFFHFQATGQPFVTLKAAMTLDGKIATRTGDSQWITGEAARRRVHQLRAQSGAVLAGINTILADDAELTARLPNVILPRQPLRVIVDSHLRTPPDCRAARTARAYPETHPLLIATTEKAAQEQERGLSYPGIEILRLPATEQGRVELQALCALLAQRRIISLLVEGGGEIHAAFLAALLTQQVLFFIAPTLIGGRDAPTPIGGVGVGSLAEAIALKSLRVRRYGNDLAIEGRLRDFPYYAKEVA